MFLRRSATGLMSRAVKVRALSLHTFGLPRSSSVTNSWTYVLLLTKWKNNNTLNNTGFRDIDQATHYTNSKKDTAALSFISFRQQICGCLKKLIDFRSNSNIFLWHVFGRVVYHMYDYSKCCLGFCT